MEGEPYLEYLKLICWLGTELIFGRREHLGPSTCLGWQSRKIENCLDTRHIQVLC
jgi:hypothetical protein